MNIDTEKQRIIEALQHRDEEWLILAFKKLLDIDPPPSFSNELRSILEDRLEIYKTDSSNMLSLDELKQSF